jgi:hypothetical protein
VVGLNPLISFDFIFEVNPNGIASQSPRLLYSATLGRDVVIRGNPERGCVLTSNEHSAT